MNTSFYPTLPDLPKDRLVQLRIREEAPDKEGDGSARLYFADTGKDFIEDPTDDTTE